MCLLLEGRGAKKRTIYSRKRGVAVNGVRENQYCYKRGHFKYAGAGGGRKGMGRKFRAAQKKYGGDRWGGGETQLLVEI